MTSIQLKSAFLYVTSKLSAYPDVKTANAIELVQAVVRITKQETVRAFRLTREERNAVVREVLLDLAKGPDGLFGTRDDLMSEATYRELCQLVGTSFLNHMIQLVSEIQERRCSAIGRRLPFCCMSMI